MPECFFAWFISSCVQELEDTLLNKRQTAFEWGAGKSTIWLARRVKSVISVEHDSEWKARVDTWLREEHLTNTLLFHCPLDASYEEQILKYPDGFDVVLIDGRRRSECIQNAMGKVKQGGFIVVDDTEREQYQGALALFGEGWERRDWTDGKKYTSIFFKDS